MANNNQYNITGSLTPGRSVFDLSYSKVFNCDMGQLIPVMHDEVIPGDVINIGNEIVVRFQPLVAPILHEVNCFVHYYFIPYRLLTVSGDTGDWEGFITGGEDGLDTSVIPRWENHSDTALYSLWDYFGFPTGVTVPASWSMAPIDYPKRAYNLVWNEWYRDQTHQTELVIETATDVQKRNWEKDYFTSSLPWQQRGTAPALPLSGTTNVDYPAYSQSGSEITFRYDTTNEQPWDADTKTALEKGEVDFSNATTFDVADLRLTFAIQEWMERNARCGGRYVEFIRAHFGKGNLRDDRVDRPEYIGGTKQSVIVSEVLNTSSTATEDQGNMAGHGLSADGQHAAKYRVPEYGMILGLLSIMPRTVYGQGIDRQWLRETKYDFYHPEFAHLSEQAIYKAELYMDGSATDDDVFGYQGRYDEMRTKKDLYCGDMRSTFDYWHLGRQFASVPSLNSTFITCTPRTDIFASTSEPGCIVHCANRITAVRPMPIMSNPGLV